jgi:hypothetical protein
MQHTWFDGQSSGPAHASPAASGAPESATVTTGQVDPETHAYDAGFALAETQQTCPGAMQVVPPHAIAYPLTGIASPGPAASDGAPVAASGASAGNTSDPVPPQAQSNIAPRAAIAFACKSDADRIGPT